MKILLINNFHYLRGGSERAYFDLAKILESHGHEVAFFSMRDEKNQLSKWDKYFVDNVDYNAKDLSVWQKVRMAQRLIFNFQAKRNLEKLILDFQPDVAHLHNIYHQLSLSVIYALKKHSIPMVLTLHDYKLISPNYNLFLRGKIWEKKSLWACIEDRCVKDSYLKSALGAFEKFLHYVLGTYAKINLFISPSIFLTTKFKEFSFPGKIEHISNPLLGTFCSIGTVDDTRGPLVYYGRLSKEKGIAIAIQAIKDLPEEKLQIVGDGPEKDNLEKLVEELGLENRVDFTGFKDGEELKEILNKAKAILIPSIWYENMPYAIAEALCLKKIVIASDIGGIPDLITDSENGLLFKPGMAESLAGKIKQLNAVVMEKIKINATKSAERFSSENYYSKIMAAYENIIAERKSSRT